MVKGDLELRRAVELAARKSGSAGLILIVVDSDDDCPAELGPQLVAAASSQRGDREIVVAVAKREFEAWFLAGVRSLRGRRGVSSQALPPADPEAIRGAKEALRECLDEGESYLESADQAAFCSALDLDQASIAPSFARCRRRVQEALLRLADAAGNDADA